ncbi:MAG: hypothetical protein QNJ74_07775 [Trichodesmium sp. MO_231.B1]|nr:hypothetical protein [Trichodesmium sp. MO_231.B1]
MSRPAPGIILKPRYSMSVAIPWANPSASRVPGVTIVLVSPRKNVSLSAPPYMTSLLPDDNLPVKITSLPSPPFRESVPFPP